MAASTMVNPAAERNAATRGPASNRPRSGKGLGYEAVGEGPLRPDGDQHMTLKGDDIPANALLIFEIDPLAVASK